MPKTLMLLMIAFTFLFWFSSPICTAQSTSEQQKVSTGSRASESNALPNLEREKLDFEKFNEGRKATYELIKAIVTGAALLIPLLLGVYTVRSQIRSAYELKRIESENAFALKAAEIVMDAKNPYGVRKKAEVLLDLFRERLPENFVSSFDPKKHAHIGPSTESKMDLLKLIASNPEKEEDIVKLWRRMFPGDRIEELFPGDYSEATSPKNNQT